MIERPQIQPSAFGDVFGDLGVHLGTVCARKGLGALVSRHEILGVLAEEYHELVEAVHSKSDVQRIEAELMDIAGGAMFALMSIRANGGKI